MLPRLDRWSCSERHRSATVDSAFNPTSHPCNAALVDCSTRSGNMSIMIIHAAYQWAVEQVSSSSTRAVANRHSKQTRQTLCPSPWTIPEWPTCFLAIYSAAITPSRYSYKGSPSNLDGVAQTTLSLHFRLTQSSGGTFRKALI